jgi:hypothetical protein
VMLLTPNGRVLFQGAWGAGMARELTAAVHAAFGAHATAPSGTRAQ